MKNYHKTQIAWNVLVLCTQIELILCKEISCVFLAYIVQKTHETIKLTNQIQFKLSNAYT